MSNNETLYSSGKGNDGDFPFIDLVEMARSQFLALLKMSGFNSTEQSCVFGSHFLYMILQRFSPQGTSVSIMSGGQRSGTGFKDESGAFHKHMWVQFIAGEHCWVVDITADQFGFAPVFYAKAEEAKSTFIPDTCEIAQGLLEHMHRDDDVLRKMYYTTKLNQDPV